LKETACRLQSTGYTDRWSLPCRDRDRVLLELMWLWRSGLSLSATWFNVQTLQGLYTHTHTYTQKNTHTHNHTQTLTRTHTNTHAQTQTLTQTFTHKHTHSHTNIHTQTQTLTHKHYKGIVSAELVVKIKQSHGHSGLCLL
jgi:hypothetical protein